MESVEKRRNVPATGRRYPQRGTAGIGETTAMPSLHRAVAGPATVVDELRERFDPTRPIRRLRLASPEVPPAPVTVSTTDTVPPPELVM